MSQYSDKPCARCGGNKGPKYESLKYCGKCKFVIKKERSSNAHGRALEQRYGITRADYWNLYRHQDGACYICRRATGKTRRLTVDHDHATGLVRGLLCRPCNTMLGHLRDSIAAFQRAIDYLEAPPFQSMIGVKRSLTLEQLDGGQ